MSHETFTEMEKACNREDGIEFNPDYPATLDDAIEMIVRMFDEEVEKQTDETKGYKAGLLMGINILDTLKRISSRKEADKQL